MSYKCEYCNADGSICVGNFVRCECEVRGSFISKCWVCVDCLNMYHYIKDGKFYIECKSCRTIELREQRIKWLLDV